MLNPNGPYPGRQLFLGLTSDRKSCLVYLVTGRSPESRQRKAIEVDNSVRIAPVENGAYDPLRHYTALKYDNRSGVAVVSNGIQTEAIFETYRLLCNVGSPAAKDYMENILEGSNAEPDSLHTPRIAGTIISNKGSQIMIEGIKTTGARAAVRQFSPVAGKLAGISTYGGNLDSPEPRDPSDALAEMEFPGKTPVDLANYLYDISAADYKGEDIRVCAVAAVYAGDTWTISIVNKHE